MKPCGTNWVKIKGAQLKNNLHHPVVHRMIKNDKRTMMIRCILTELLECKVRSKCLSPYVSTVWELEVAITLSGSIRLPWFFDNIWSVFNTLSVCVTWFLIQILQFLSNMNQMVHTVWTLLASDLMAYKCMFQKLPGIGMSNIDCLIANVM